MSLSPDLIQELLKRENSGGRKYDKATSIPQNGPLRWYDREMRCVSLGCGSPTYCKIEGSPRCSAHALKELNALVIEMQERVLA